MGKTAFRKVKKALASPVATLALFAVAALLLLGSTIGGARAALTFYSENYTASVELYNIGVTLLENGTPVSWRNYGNESDGEWTEKQDAKLLSHLEGRTGEDSFKVGKIYPEELSVRNSGTIDQYVRVTIYKYWLDRDGKKMQALSPDMIELELNLEPDADGNCWLVDEEASTAERTVLYYNHILGTGRTTSPLSSTIKISNWVASKVSETAQTEGGHTTITTVYDYDGVTFQLEAKVDAVQTHSAADAIWSAWGSRVGISGNGTLSLRTSSISQAQVPEDNSSEQAPDDGSQEQAPNGGGQTQTPEDGDQAQE